MWWKTFTKINSLEEIIGLVAISAAIAGAVIQFIKTSGSENVSSFAVTSLFFIAIGEMLFAGQGFLKKSPTITITRIVSAVWYTYLIVLYYKHENKHTIVPTDKYNDCVAQCTNN